jgi:hypothetical protein
LPRLHTAFALLLASTLHAQWLNYPSLGVPKNEDGSINLIAPAPRTSGGKPDFSGIWLAERNRPCPPEGCADMEIGQEFMNIGWSLPGGLPYQPWAASLVKERIAENSKSDPGSLCLPTGIIKMHTSPFFRRVVQTPDMLLILTERDAEFRQIFTDGRPLPVNPQPTPNGYSTGKWDGDTLVVESNGFPDGQWLDRNGSPSTEAAKITERFRRPSYGTLEIAITVNDPKAYTHEWTIKLNQHIAVNTDLLNYYCMENEKDRGHLVGK